MTEPPPPPEPPAPPEGDVTEPPAPAPTEPPADAAEATTRRRPSARAVGIGCLVVALLSTGAAGGWWLRGATDDDETTTVTDVGVAVVRPVEVLTTDDADGRSVTPSVVGLTEGQARAVFVDAGLADDDIRFESVETAGDPGVVIDQDPRPAEPLIDDVVLFLSQQTDTPDLIGEQTAAARDALAAYGARGVITRRYVDGATPETIVETTPAAGEPLGYEVELVVAEPPAAMFLRELDSVESDGGCRRDDIQIAGTIHDDSLTCTPDETDVDYLEYALNNQLSTLTATIGVSDRADDTSVVIFRVWADDRPAEWTLAYGESEDITVDLTDVLRLRLEVTRAAGTDDRGGVTTGWGAPQLLGSIDAIDAMRAQPDS